MTDDSAFQIDLPILDRYLAGTASPDERASVASALEGNAELRYLVEVLQGAGQVGWDGDERDVDRAWHHDWRKINSAPSLKTSTRSTRYIAWSLGLIAAAAGVFLVTRPHGERSSATSKIYATSAGQQGFMTLVDGTRVTLGPRTTLRVTPFDANARTIDVDGEAYFEVARSSSVPFVVRSGTFTTRVLGTAFMVRHVPGQAHIVVAVAEGKVRVTHETSDRREMTLTAGTIGEMQDTTSTIRTVDELAPGTELLHGKLVFHHTPVSTVLETLSRWYGYQFRCSDPTLARQYVTIGVSVRSSAAALASLESILDVTLNVTGDTVTLTPQNTRPVPGTPRVRAYDVWNSTREVGR